MGPEKVYQLLSQMRYIYLEKGLRVRILVDQINTLPSLFREKER
jgi:hypothetical protein